MPANQRNHLGVFLVCAVNNGSAADLGHFDRVPKKGPAADLLAADDILDEKNPLPEPQGQLVEELHVLQQVVVGVATVTEVSWR